MRYNCQITNITSNEPINGTGDGDTSPDWEFVDDTTSGCVPKAPAAASVASTRTVTCTDAAGNVATRTVEVHVGHNIISPTSGTAFKINTGHVHRHVLGRSRAEAHGGVAIRRSHDRCDHH